MIGLLTAPSKLIALMVVIVIMMILISEFAVIPLTASDDPDAMSDLKKRLGMGVLTFVFLAMAPFVVAKLTTNEVASDTKSLASGTMSAATSVRNLVTGN